MMIMLPRGRLGTECNPLQSENQQRRSKALFPRQKNNNHTVQLYDPK